jgi:hypothetical protein
LNNKGRDGDFRFNQTAPSGKYLPAIVFYNGEFHDPVGWKLAAGGFYINYGVNQVSKIQGKCE